jgi:hypothetical protein
MAVYRVQIGFPFDSALPKDVITINPHYSGSDPQGLADRLKSNLIAGAIGASGQFTIKVYDAQKPPPSYPLYTTSNGTGFWTTTNPHELAVCLSYFAQWNRPTFRGRLYIPSHFIGGVLALRPSSAQRTAVGAWAGMLTSGLPAAHFWVLYSRKMDTASQVTDWWVNDEWDVVRSRGLRETTRTVGTIP